MGQIEYIGPNQLDKLEDVISSIKPSSIFLVTGKRSYALSGAKHKLEKTFALNNVTHFSQVDDPPSYQSVQAGIERFRRTKPELVIAIGGGSVIDTAKLINFFSSQSIEPMDYLKGEPVELIKPDVFIAIPTTAGTGSESTQFAVLYVDKIKYSIDNPWIMPDYCIVDANLTRSMPKKIAASSALDALCQAIESYWSVQSTEESKEYAKKAIQMILPNIRDAVIHKNEESIEKMALAAHWAGKAIQISRTTAPHALSYALTSHYGIPHGEAVALTLGEIMEFNYEVTEDTCNDNRGVEYVRSTINEMISMFGASTVVFGKRILKDILVDLEMPTKLSNYSVQQSDLDFLREQVNTQRLGNNPRKMKQKDILMIYNTVM